LSTIVERSIFPVAGEPFYSTNTVYFIAHDVDGLEPGAYYFNPNRERVEPAFELLKKGSFRNEAAYLTLEQDLGGDASVTFFLMANLGQTLEALGNRGYRVAQMEAGIIGGKMYLAAYALGRGATGLTFYDDDVTSFFSPHSADKSCMLVVSVGVPGMRPIY
jgi:SagB-type dehydrogenase family enzyme